MATLFLTGRRKIRRGDVHIRAHVRGDHAHFEAELDLSRYRLPDAARVFIEAYSNVAFQRYDFGTKEQPYARVETQLTEFEPSDRPQFRVKVVNAEGAQLLAGVEHLRADWGDEQGGRSWLQVVPKPNSQMQGELWRVEHPYGPEWQLWINRDAGQLYSRVNTHDPMVCGLIMPAAFRAVLEHDFIENEGHPDSETPWVRQASRLAGREMPRGEDGDPAFTEVRQWITEAIGAFSREQHFTERVTRMAETDEEQS